MTVDYDDPVAVLAIIRPAYYALLAGQQVQNVDIPTAGGSHKRVTYHNTDIAKLEQEVRRLEALVATKNGIRKRFAFRAG